MEYRHLGKAGIQVSELSFGSWVTFHTQADVDAAVEMMAAAYDAGVNFFDNAEVYAGGKSEEVMGEALKKLGWRRSSYLVSTKIYWGLKDKVNERNTLNRKRLIEGINGSLERLGLDYVDILYCHRPDKNHADRRDGLGDAQYHRMGQGHVLGHVRMVRGGDRVRDRDRRTTSPS